MTSVSVRCALPAILLVTIFSLAQHAFAQGEYVRRGANGLLIGGEMAPDEDRTSYIATAGFSYGGRVDLRLGYGWLDTMADTLGGHVTGRALRPGMSLHLIKQGETYPFTFSVLATYQQSTWDADLIGADEVTGSTYEVGGFLHTIIRVADIVGFRPSLGIVHQNREREYVFPDQPARSFERTDRRYVAGIELVVMPTSRTVLFGGPLVSLTAGERSVGVTGGLVFN